MLQDDVKSEPEETPIVSPAEEESKYPEELFNLATLAEVSLAYAGQLHQSSFTEQINQARSDFSLNFTRLIISKKWKHNNCCVVINVFVINAFFTLYLQWKPL